VGEAGVGASKATDLASRTLPPTGSTVDTIKIKRYNFDRFSLDEMIIETGITFSGRQYGFDIFGLETGYRYQNNTHNYFFRIKLNPIINIVTILLGIVHGS
jgi:hypothetical protein